jgi:hypothetical protein
MSPSCDSSWGIRERGELRRLRAGRAAFRLDDFYPALPTWPGRGCPTRPESEKVRSSCHTRMTAGVMGNWRHFWGLWLPH